MRRLLVVLVFMGSQGQACLNTYKESLHGIMHRDDQVALRGAVQRLAAEHATHPSVENSNDLAVAHILLKNHDAAIALLTTLEKEHPGLSRTASNLGTALELAGHNKEALHWIREGIVRNPADHEGTEWLHVKILEAKLALAKDAAWLKTHHVLGIDFGRGPHPVKPAALPVDHEGKPRSFADTEKAIAYQMHERLRFVSRPDFLIGDIYFTRADIARLEQQKAQNVFDYYIAAHFFGVADPVLLQLRARQFMKNHGVLDPAYIFWPAPLSFRQDSTSTLPLYALALLGGIVLLVIVWRWRRRLKNPVDAGKEAA
jgi:tetratricopeptide (TPR) repeat protein